MIRLAFNIWDEELDSSASLPLGMAKSKRVIVCVVLYLIYDLNTLRLDNRVTLSHQNSRCLRCRDTTCSVHVSRHCLDLCARGMKDPTAHLYLYKNKAAFFSLLVFVPDDCYCRS